MAALLSFMDKNEENANIHCVDSTQAGTPSVIQRNEAGRKAFV
jgi:hypothetical protein